MIQPTSVPAPDRDVEGSPATPEVSPRSALHARSADPGEYHNPREGTALTGAQLHSQNHSAPHRVECRAGGTVAAPLTATVNVGSMAAGSPVPRAPQSREIPRPAPDAFSAGTRRLGRGRSRRTAPPHHSAVTSVAAFSRSHLAAPTTEPVTKYPTQRLIHWRRLHPRQHQRAPMPHESRPLPWLRHYFHSPWLQSGAEFGLPCWLLRRWIIDSGRVS